jgi:two-component system C4-dicarboxylate transport sensor histidine kinase DctB
MRDFSGVLRKGADPDLVRQANLELERINRVAGALDTYLMDRTGLTIAASNWASDKPFVGNNFSYRPYFQAAMQGKTGIYFALGTTSGERGYYFAYPVRDGGDIAGAIVTKIKLGHLEAGWRSPDGEIIVTDPHGVIFMSSDPDWLYRTLEPLSAAIVGELMESRQYNRMELNALKADIRAAGNDGTQFMTIAEATGGTSRPQTATEYLLTEADMADAGWRVIMLADTQYVDWQAQISIIITALMMVSLTLSAAIVHQRRRRISERIAMQEAAKGQLEQRVEQRTAELVEANKRLTAEIQDRQRAEEELRRTQSELVQATKLAALGQMSAGLSHELNQPLAAIETYADNARAFLERGDFETASGNLSSISNLIHRMARIIRNLRTYARNEPVLTRPTSLRGAVENALTLLQQRIENANVTVHYDPHALDLAVVGGNVRLQQVFVNLLSNAIDALSDRGERSIWISSRREDGGKLCIAIRDSGPGIPPEHLKNVFDPFYSTKDVGKGTGLGLSITFGIIKQFGGTIDVSNHPDGGAEFCIRLVEIADQTGEAA